jgi:hypothetical protein
MGGRMMIDVRQFDLDLVIHMLTSIFCSNIDKIKSEAVWNDEAQRWKVPDLTVEKTKLPPAGRSTYISTSSFLAI